MNSAPMNADNTWPPNDANDANAEPAPPSPVISAMTQEPSAQLPKNPSLAAFLSLFPGIGNVYNGLYLRGLTFFLIVVSAITITNRHPLFGTVIAFFWIFNLIDSYRQAVLINYGYAQDLGLLDRPRHPRAGQGGVAAGVILTLIGFLAVLDQYFNVDLEWIFNLWPVALMVIGLWLVVGSLRERRQG
jgi:hypothetical protein